MGCGIKMPKEEVTNNRPSNYSQWRRKKGDADLNFCYMTDGDWFEQRMVDGELVSVAYIETIQIPNVFVPENYPVWNSKIALIRDIHDKMGIPCFVVWHTSDCELFFVQKYPKKDYVKLDQKTFVAFIRGLGKRLY